MDVSSESAELGIKPIPPPRLKRSISVNSAKHNPLISIFGAANLYPVSEKVAKEAPKPPPRRNRKYGVVIK